jgi:hypothetical protein
MPFVSHGNKTEKDVKKTPLLTMGLIFKTPQAGGHVCNCSITGEGGLFFALFQAKDREHCPYTILYPHT